MKMYDGEMNKFSPHYHELTILRRQLYYGGLFCFLVLIAVLTAALYFLNANEKIGAYLTAGGVVCFMYSYVLGHLHENCDPDTRMLRSSLGIATAITGVRGAAIAFLAALLFVPLPSTTWMVAGVYAFVVLCDFFDGVVARSLHHETILGSKFDVQMDALGLLVASLLAIKVGRLPSWYLLFSGAYYVYQLLIWMRHYWLSRAVYVERVLPSPRTRLYAGFQMGLIVVCLMPTVQIWALSIIATTFMIPSLFTFVRDYMIVCGTLHPHSAVYSKMEKTGARILYETCPVVVRCAIAALVAFGMLGVSDSVLHRVCSGEFGSGFAHIYLAIFPGTAVLILFGRFSRLAAASCCLAILAVPVNLLPVGIVDEVLVFAFCYVLLFGRGISRNRNNDSMWLMKRHRFPMDFRTSVNQ